MFHSLYLSLLLASTQPDTMVVPMREIEVKSSRVPESLLRTPSAVTVVDRARFANGRAIGLDDALTGIPGVLVQSRGGAQDVRITIRGYGARGNGDRSNSGSMRGIRVLTDGIPVSEPDGRTSLDLVNIGATDRVDVSRSNVSALYGNASGGVVNLRTNVDFDRPYLQWTESGGDFGLRLTYAIGPYWFARGLPEVGLRLAVEMLGRRDNVPRTRSRARALFEAGWQCCHLGRYEEAQRWLGESLAISRELGDQRLHARLLQPLGMAAFGRGDLEAARGYLREAIDIARRAVDKRELAAALNGLAQLHRIEGELDAAEPLYDDAVKLFREIGDRESVAIGLLNLAMVSIGRGSVDGARHMLTETVAIATEIGSKPVAQGALDVSAGFSASLNQFECAARFFGAAQGQALAIGLQRDPTDEAFLLPLIDRARAALGNAAFERAELSGRALSYEQGIDEARAWLEHAS